MIILYILLGLVYVVIPVDFLPDSMGVVGRIDDICVLGFILVESYRYHAAVHMQKELLKGLGSGKNWDPRRVLEISANASEKDIQQNFHRLIQQYDPSRMNRFDLKIRRLAAHRVTEIKRAFDELSPD